MNEDRRAAGVDEPLHWRAAAVRCQLIAALAIRHPVDRTLAVELLAALAKAEDRAVAQEERHPGCSCVEAESLDNRSCGGLHLKRWGPIGELHEQVARANPGDRRRGAAALDHAAGVLMFERAGVGNWRRRTSLQRPNRDPHCRCAQRGNGDFDWLAGNHDVGRAAAADDPVGDGQSRACGAKLPEGGASVNWRGHLICSQTGVGVTSSFVDHLGESLR